MRWELGGARIGEGAGAEYEELPSSSSGVSAIDIIIGEGVGVGGFALGNSASPNSKWPSCVGAAGGGSDFFGAGGGIGKARSGMSSGGDSTAAGCVGSCSALASTCRKSRASSPALGYRSAAVRRRQRPIRRDTFGGTSGLKVLTGGTSLVAIATKSAGASCSSNGSRPTRSS